MNRPIAHEAVLEAALRAYRPGITREQAVVIAFTELDGDPLNPEAFDDAAILLRAERLLIDGLSVPHALDTARNERITWRIA